MKRILALAACMVLLVVGMAKADTLVTGAYSSVNWIDNSIFNNNGVITTSLGGGSYDVSTLNGQDLDFLYCVDLLHYVSVPGTYSNTIGTTTATINNALLFNAGKVAWLLDNYAAQVKNTVNEGALQAAIWHVIYAGVNDGNRSYDLGTGSSLYTEYSSMLAAVANNSGEVSHFLWLTPGTSTTDIGTYQGLVTRNPVPEPATMLLFGAGIAGLAAVARRKRS